MGENESSKYWLSVLNGLKNRGVKDILIICADGLNRIKKAISVGFPKTEYQCCIVHQVWNTMKYVADKDRKPFCADLKTIYKAPNEEKALDAQYYHRRSVFTVFFTLYFFDHRNSLSH